ncbi:MULTISPECIES: hypothetical protein [unclassified Pseudomonas]|uniref:hypothetical protein n=1 Tax=unclassified Pseudomonas TaxID=196821 RepID=UPI00200F3CF4|nr:MULTISPECIES: hypothetical protein [unclassified Pseudomonas]
MKERESMKSFTLILCALDGSMSPPAQTTESPVWSTVSDAIENAFQNDGFVDLRVIGSSFVKELCMKSLSGKYRMVASTRSDDPKLELMEWWELGDSPFRGVEYFGDDALDLRTVCSDVSVARGLFKEIYDSGELKTGLLQMRSQWDPKQ